MKRSEKILFTLFIFALFAGSCVDFFNVAWGTGVWLGEFALTWGILFAFFCICFLVSFILLVRVVWRERDFKILLDKLIFFRNNLKWGRWLLLAMIFVFPIGFLQFTLYGVVFKGLYLRLTLWALQLFLLSFLLTTRKDVLIDWMTFLFCLVCTAGSFSVSTSFSLVADYPFSLGWSEGNRLWDYSILFGSDRYDYPEGQKIEVFLDIGRQLVGGLPFLIPGLTIGAERAWVALTSILPYIFLGIVAFRSSSHEKYVWFAAILWTYLFLKQGPIHAPLVLCAVLIALAWKSNIWISVFLLAVATCAAYLSRYTWTFAPVIWFVLLEFLDAGPARGNKIHLTPRLRSFLKLFVFSVVGVVFVLGVTAYFVPGSVGKVSGIFQSLEISPENVQEKISQQELLWYRLLPNETYGNGILMGLSLAILPLAGILLYLLISGKWAVNVWQKWATVFFLLAFLVVGLIISTKIGGGGDLHNMDMFLIGLFFVAIIVFYNGGRGWLQNSGSEPLWIKTVLVLLIALPAIGSLLSLRSYNFRSATPWLVVLTDVSNESALDMYPSEDVIQKSLNTIQYEVNLAKTQGDVLFMDQRQLLTFGFIQNVPLVPDYDKKVLMERALTADDEFFREFYRDLEKGRFSLIVVQPLNRQRKGSEFEFGEENNAWVKWVAKPLLCFYEVKQVLIDANVQLLVPKMAAVNCAESLP